MKGNAGPVGQLPDGETLPSDSKAKEYAFLAFPLPSHCRFADGFGSHAIRHFSLKNATLALRLHAALSK